MKFKSLAVVRTNDQFEIFQCLFYVYINKIELLDRTTKIRKRSFQMLQQ